MANRAYDYIDIAVRMLRVNMYRSFYSSVWHQSEIGTA